MTEHFIRRARSYFKMKVLHDDVVVDLIPTGNLQVLEEDASVLLLELKGGEGECIFLRVPRYNAKIELILAYRYIVDLYKSNHWQDDDYSRIKYKSSAAQAQQKAVGYIFPIATLALGQSIIQSEVETVAAYALAAIIELARASEGQKSLIAVSWGESYGLADIYEDDLVVAIYSEERLSCQQAEVKELVRGFCISLAKVKLFAQNIGPLRAKKADEPFVNVQDVYVRSMPPELKGQCFDFLASHVLPAGATECDPIVRFFLQYQFFEIMMHHVFAGVIRDFLKVVSLPAYAEDAWKTKDLVGDLSKKSAESYRISRVFDYVSREHPELANDVEQACADVLVRAGKEVGGKSSYYLLRNLIFHGFGSGAVSRADIESVCEPVERVIHQVALGFEHMGEYFSPVN